MARLLLLLFAVLPSLAAAGEDPVRFRTLPAPAGLRAQVKVVYPELGGSPVQRAATRAIRQRCDEILREFSKDVRETPEPIERYLSQTGERLVLTIEPTVSMNSPRRVSVLLTVFTYLGGPHPTTGHETFVFAADGRGAKRVRLGDLLRPGLSPQAFAKAELLSEVNALKAARGFDDAITEFDPDALESFVATPAGLTWVFSEYVLGPYVEGAYIVKLPWERLRPYLREPIPLP